MSGQTGQQITTLPRHRDVAAVRHGRDLRRIGIAALCVLVAVALAGLLGPRSTVTSARDAQQTLTVQHGQITRPGIPVPFEITLIRDAGFDAPVTLAISTDLVDRLDFNNWYPNPDSETSRREWVEYEFGQPPGTEFHLSLDARTAPGQWPSSNRYMVSVIEDGRATTTVEFRMTVLP